MSVTHVPRWLFGDDFLQTLESLLNAWPLGRLSWSSGLPWAASGFAEKEMGARRPELDSALRELRLRMPF